MTDSYEINRLLSQSKDINLCHTGMRKALRELQGLLKDAHSELIALRSRYDVDRDEWERIEDLTDAIEEVVET